MTAPRRWLEDPDADESLRELLRGAPNARPLDQVTRRRLGVKVARVSALPVAAAGWLFVKSATAALGVVLGTGALAVSAGIIEWGPPKSSHVAPTVPSASPAPRAPARSAPAAPKTTEAPEIAPEAPALPAPQLNPTPSLPVVDSSGSSRLSAEAALLEAARAKLRRAPAEALALTTQHAVRFQRGQLASERALIRIEALHRLGRDAEARGVARELLGDAGAGLYAERVRQLLGDGAL